MGLYVCEIFTPQSISNCYYDCRLITEKSATKHVTTSSYPPYWYWHYLVKVMDICVL